MELDMQGIHGWTGKLLRIDLTRRSSSIEKWDHAWIGGKGFGVCKLLQEEPVDGDDFDPRRVLIFSAGPLTGTIAPSSSRGNVSNRHLVSGGISTSSIGGFFPAEMKFAGYDHVLISGKADAPVYLYIHNDQVNLLDASHLWGKDTWQTDTAIRNRHKDPGLRVVSIGPAGENRVRLACIIGDRNRAASWGGNGALMGAKNLKAIAVRGTHPITIANPSSFADASRQARDKVNKTMGAKLLRRGGTLGVISSELNPLSFKNYEDERWDPAKADGLTYKVFRKKYGGRPVGCFNCPIACGRFFEIKEGKYAGLKMEGVQLNALRGLASNLDITAADDIIMANALANRYGLGIDGIAAAVGWVMDCFEKGMITAQDLGYDVRWGDINSFVRLAEDITFRKGLGDILAEGIQNTARVIGRGSEKRAVLVKGAEVNEGRLRSNRAWALGIVASPRSGGHLDGAPAMEGVGFDNDLCTAVYGIPNTNDAAAYEHKAKFVVFTERLKMLVDSLGLCYYTSVWSDPNALQPEDYVRLYKEATGNNKSAEALLEIAEKAINIEKAFNTLHGGFIREHDYPPSRFLKEPIKSGPSKGVLIETDGWNLMLDEYYELHGWDKKTGLQSASRLVELGLKEVVDGLSETGRLTPKNGSPI